MKKIRIFLSLMLLTLGSVAFAQNIQVSGTVRESNGDAVSGAAVQLKGSTTVYTMTDALGHYSLSVPANGALAVSCLGYHSAEVEVAGRGIIDVVLTPDLELLDEVIVTAYGTSTKGTFTGSASVMKSEEIEKRQVSDITQALSGAVSGVQILSDNGQPGVSATIRVRGVGSINASSAPLILVDGMPISDMSSVNPDDIESLTVLKDAASTSLYGARGANGIIMITTKRGKTNEATVNFDAKVGVNSRMIKTYDVLTDPAEYTELTYQALYNRYFYNTASTRGNAAKSAENANVQLPKKGNGGLGYQIYTVPKGESVIVDGKLNPNATLGYSDGDYTYLPDDWAKETFSNNVRQEYNINFSANTGRLNYYASFGYLDDSGVIANSNFKRLTGRLKADYQIKDWLKVGGNFAYTNTTSNYPSEQTTTNSSGNAFFIANFIAPIYPIYVRDANGNIMTDPNNGRPIYDYGDGVSTHGNRPFMSIANPAGDLVYNIEDYLMDIMTLNWFAELKPFKGLTLTAKWGLNVDNTRYNNLGNAFYGQSASYGGTATQEFLHAQRFDQQYLADYEFSIADKHDFDLTAGYDGYKYFRDWVEGYGTDLYNPFSFYVSNAIADKRKAYGGADSHDIQGYFARLNYDFDQKYIASFSVRRDGSSRFAPAHRWGTFMSASAAWLITKEDFMRDVTWLDMLKFKASIGQQGNENIGNYYAYLDQYSVTGSEGKFADGTLSYKGNPDLTWETSTSYNVGFDFSMFRDRLSGTIEYFGRTSGNMLYNKPVAPINGYSEIPMNVGSMRNSGLEIELAYDIIRGRNVSWTVNGNASFIRNKILALHPDLEGELVDGSRIYTEGESMYRMYLVEYAGVDKETGLALYNAKDKSGQVYTTSDYSTASDFKVATGDLLPKVYGGFGSSLNAYGVDFSFQFAYQLGGTMYDSGYQRLMHNGYSSNAGNNWHVDIRNAWTPDNKDSNIPRLDAADQYGSSTSTRWLTSSNYLALNNVTLGYTFPAKWLNKINVKALRIYCAADNVALLSARKGLDPRQSYVSATTARYTPIRTVSGGITLTF